MIQEYLERHYKFGRLHSSYIINVDKIDVAIKELESFIQANILTKGNFNLNPDYRYIEKANNTTNNISVGQIRQLQEFLHKTSIISGKKVAVIYEADKMNLNAANCCLKILEEPPKDTYLFLVTTRAASILTTILSRCVKINHHYNNSEKYNIDESFINPLLKSTPISDKLLFMKKFASKDRDLWIDFTSSMELLIVKLCRNIIGVTKNLSESEKVLLSQFKSNSLQYLQRKHEEITKIINDTNNFDLDLKASSLLLINKFRK